MGISTRTFEEMLRKTYSLSARLLRENVDLKLLVAISAASWGDVSLRRKASQVMERNRGLEISFEHLDSAMPETCGPASYISQ